MHTGMHIKIMLPIPCVIPSSPTVSIVVVPPLRTASTTYQSDVSIVTVPPLGSGSMTQQPDVIMDAFETGPLSMLDAWHPTTPSNLFDGDARLVFKSDGVIFIDEAYSVPQHESAMLSRMMLYFSEHGIPRQMNYSQLMGALAELNDMAISVRVKNSIAEQVLYLVTQDRPQLPHTILTGSSQHKRDISELLTQIWDSMGLISNNIVLRLNRQNAIGPYLGSTAQQTQRLLNDTEAGVVMIEDSGSLCNDVFGQEAISTIVIYMVTSRSSIMIADVDQESTNYAYRVLTERFTWRFDLG